MKLRRKPIWRPGKARRRSRSLIQASAPKLYQRITWEKPNPLQAIVTHRGFD